MNRYLARDLLQLPLDQLWALPEERHIIVFDDGEIKTHTRATIQSVYMWYPLLEFPDVPLLKVFHLDDRRFNSKVMLKQLNAVIWKIDEVRAGQVNTEHLARRAFETINRFYNDFTVNLSEWVATLSMFDIMEVMDQAQIREARENVISTQYGIEDVCYKQIKDTILNAADLNGNPIAEAARSGTIKMDQLLQCVGPRGFMTDINSDIFPEPITTGYIEGINDLYGSLIESRSGSKSLLYNKELLRNTEYFNRKTQLVAQYVRNLHKGDCGSPHLVDFPVTKRLLPQLKGKFYVTDAGTLTPFTGTETHLIDTTVRIRSVLGCIHPDPAGICEVCYGKLYSSIPAGTNAGQVSAVCVGDKITSSVLSTKHLDSTSKVEQFQIHETEGKYLRTGKEAETLYLRPKLKGKGMRLTVSSDEVEYLSDVFFVPNLDEHPVENVSELTQIQITVDNGRDGQVSDILRVSLYNRKASFSHVLLKHIKEHKWSYNSQGDVVIELTGFDTDQPFLTLPYKHVNMFEIMMHIQSFLHSGTDGDSNKLGDKETRAKRAKNKFLKQYKNPTEALVQFATMLNDRLSVNLVHCEVLIYAMMVRSSSMRDYRLPKPGLAGSFEKYANLMMNRSLAAAMAFERQNAPLISPASFIYVDRNDHPYDMLVMGGRMTDHA